MIRQIVQKSTTSVNRVPRLGYPGGPGLSRSGSGVEAEAFHAGVKLRAGKAEELGGLGLIALGLLEDIQHHPLLPFGKRLSGRVHRRA